MGDMMIAGSSLSVDCWEENIPVHQGSRELKVLVRFQSVHFPGNGNEYYITLSSEEDPSFLYKTSVTAETYQRLVRYESLVTPFQQFPNYVHALINAVRSAESTNESENFLVNILARGSAASREIEFLITARQRDCIVQSKRLSLCFHLASDVEFKEHLGNCYERIRLENNQRWQQNQMDIMQGMLESAQHIQHHYETLLQQWKFPAARIEEDKVAQPSFSFSKISKSNAEHNEMSMLPHIDYYNPPSNEGHCFSGLSSASSLFGSPVEETKCVDLEQELKLAYNESADNSGPGSSVGIKGAKSILGSDRKHGYLKGAAKRKAGPAYAKETSLSFRDYP